jgi:hypothetical protein
MYLSNCGPGDGGLGRFSLRRLAGRYAKASAFGAASLARRKRRKGKKGRHLSGPDEGLGFSLPAWLTTPATALAHTAAQAAAQAIKTNTNVTIAGRTFNMGNPADVAALRAIAAGIAGSKGAGSPVTLTVSDKPLPASLQDIATNPWALGIGALLALKFILRR